MVLTDHGACIQNIGEGVHSFFWGGGGLFPGASASATQASLFKGGTYLRGSITLREIW